MSRVSVDGEEVNFEGEIPDDPSRIYELLMGALSEQSRVVVKFFVDGKDALLDEGFPSRYQMIEAESVTHDELTLKVVIESMNQVSETENQFDAYVANVLSVAWSEVFKRMDELITKIQPFAELIDNLAPYVDAYDPPWGGKLKEVSEKQNESLGHILNAFEQGNPALLSDELSVCFLPVFKRARKLFSEDIIPYLKQRVEAE
jgi:hypothetical protein